MKTSKTICLVMIIKNEMQVLKRCFDSVYKYIDRYYICDTGSTDGTQKFVRDYFKQKKIPGTLAEDEWVSFGANRTKAVQGAYNKSDYLLLMDADFVFCVKDNNFKSKLGSDGYQIKYEGILDYRQMLFVSGRIKWHYIGRTHEYIHSEGPPKKITSFDGFTFDHKCDGGNRSDKFERDIRLLTLDLQDDPNNIRAMFYLAQSNKDLARYDEAIKYYKLRAERGGWAEETYYCLYQIGLCKLKRGDKFDDYKDDLLKAYEFRPERLEALHFLVNACRLSDRFDLGYRYGIRAVNAVYPVNDVLFIEKGIHDWAFFDELALCAHYIGKHKLALEIYKKLYDKNESLIAMGKPAIIPLDQKSRLDSNVTFFKKAYEKQIRGEFEQETNSSRVGIIIVNNNNKSATDNIINQMMCDGNDVIVIDNNSDADQISQHTTIKLYNKINITAAWMMGLNHCDMLAATTNNRYFAYIFTSSKVVFPSGNSTVMSMIKTMKQNWNVVGIHPALTSDSDPTFNYMKVRAGASLDSISHIDNIFSCYRASWLDKVGRFSLKLLYTRGVAIELGYLAEADHKILLLDNKTLVKYSEKNENETSKQVVMEYFQAKYGLNYKALLYSKLGHKRPFEKTKINKKVLTIFIIYYGFGSQMGGTYVTLRTYAEYLSGQGDKVIVLERLPTNEEIRKFEPDCIITAQHASLEIHKYIEAWNIPWIALTYSRMQYTPTPDMKYPSLVTYSNSYLKGFDKDQQNGIIVRDPINHKVYKVNEKLPTYITLVGDPPEIKGHSLFFELAKRFPNEKFMLVTKHPYTSGGQNDIPLNMTVVGHIKELEQLKEKVYSKIKVLLLPSAMEAFGRVTIEVTASKIPCIIAACPGLPEITFNMSNYVPSLCTDRKIEYDVDAWETELNRVLGDYDNEVEKAGKILEKLDFERDAKHFRDSIFAVISKFDQ